MMSRSTTAGNSDNLPPAPQTPWWEVDLGSVHWIDTVNVWSQGDFGSNLRDRDLYVFVSDVPFVSLCEGPIYFADQIARACDLEREELETVMVGLNHACWSVQHEYKGADVMPLVAEAWERR